MAIMRWHQRALSLLYESCLEAPRLVAVVSYQKSSE